ncbi:MAG TPA: choice-of-anchor tandem repeat GloVer-containing protein [Rhizomicrobium sp.]
MGFSHKFVLGCLVAAALAAASSSATAGTKKFSALYSFCRQQNCPDGAEPDTALIADDSDNIYGTTAYGGSMNCYYGCGTVFKLTPDGTETTLYSFCTKDTSCPDGYFPDSPLILDKFGNLYGSTVDGGANGQGAVFRLAPDGKETVLYNFCSRTGCADGAGPLGRVIMDRRGNLYGATVEGGTPGGNGTVFKLSPDGKEKVLYSFCQKAGCTDGSYPFGGVVMDRDGDLYGTTYQGGANSGNGTVYKVTRTGTETVLYSFCAKAGCSDGAVPESGAVMDKDGNLYGTTASGGNLSPNCPSFNGGYEGGCGVVFEVHPDLSESVLYTFCAQPDCTDGAFPLAGVTRKSGKSGDIYYGTTEFGGSKGAGVVFSLSGSQEKVLHSFCSRANCADGETPQSALLAEGDSLVGAVFQGGKYGPGAIYKLDPSAREIDDALIPKKARDSQCFCRHAPDGLE